MNIGDAKVVEVEISAQVFVYHGADRATLLVICRDGFDLAACRNGIHVSNSRYGPALLVEICAYK
jgi:hypothetical protein